MKRSFHILLLTIMLLTIAPVSQTSAIGCFPASAGTEAELASAITCFNGETAPGVYTVTLTANILLTNALPDINNVTTGVELLIEGNSHTVDGNNAVRPFSILTDTHVTMQDITVIKGYVFQSSGGAIYNDGNLTIKDSAVSDNHAGDGYSGSAGAIENLGELLIQSSVFSNNSATVTVDDIPDAYGGAIYSGGKLTIQDSSFIGNQISTTVAQNAVGGALFISGGQVRISNSTFDSNSATGTNDGKGFGGAIAGDGDWVIENSTFSNNSASNNGGAIDGGNTITINTSSFSGNSATVDGGAINTGGIATINTSSFSGNTAESSGDVIKYNGNFATLLTIANSTLANNGFNNDGATIYVWQQTRAALTNNTIINNLGQYAVYGDAGGGGVAAITAKNNIIANNGYYDCFFGKSTSSHNISSDDFTCGANSIISNNILVGPLQNNGGPTQTHALLPGSPAINAGDDATCNTAPVNNVDQRGVTRPQGTHCDVGSYEFQDPKAPNTTIANHPPKNNASADATFTFSGTDNFTHPASLTFECSLDGSAFSACSTPKNYANLSVGTHTFKVRAKDQVGNVDASPASFTWTILPSQTIKVVNGACYASSLAKGKFGIAATDPEGDALTLSIVSSSNLTLVPKANILIEKAFNNFSIVIEGAAGQTGSSLVTFKVSDGSISMKFTINFMVGTNARDVLTGTAGMDMLFGMGNNDTLLGAAASDLLCGGAGNDSLTGGLGADFFSGGPGTDTSTDFNAAQGDKKDNTIP